VFRQWSLPQQSETEPLSVESVYRACGDCITDTHRWNRLLRNLRRPAGVKKNVLRQRWSNSAPDDRSFSSDWRAPALITATLFLNFPFWYIHGNDLWMRYAFPVYTCVLALASVLTTVVFFVGPAFACQQSGRGLLGTVENSLGSIPAYCVRLCCLWFLVVWIAGLIAVPVSSQLTFILRTEVSSVQSAALAGVLLAFLFLTGLQSLQASARLALFTNKLGFAVLVAAFLRVHEGWPAALTGFSGSPERSAVLEVWRGLSVLAFYVAPLAFLAGDLVHRMETRKDAVMMGVMGIALPICGTLLLVGMIDVATLASQYYQPSLNPTVAMALWGKAAGSALPARMMITAITMFGAARFGASALATSVSTRWCAGRLVWVPLGCLIAVIAWCSIHPYAAGLTVSMDVSAMFLVVTAAVLSGDVVSGRRKMEQA
jgi:hypothetical protein